MSSSRRESRVSLNVRQNDALFEFENFKKKFLLANKHITKLNSTLSIRIEELNAQISTLYTENLRLRASEISLISQLKREREKSRRIMADAEAAAQGLSERLGCLRESFQIPVEAPPSSPTPTPPRVTRRPLPKLNTSPSSSPSNNRLSRPPNVPGIYEDDEPCPSSLTSSEDEEEIRPVKISSPRRKKPPRLSASRLPVPARVSSPPPLPPMHIDFAAGLKKKPSRRQSGLLVVDRGIVSGYPEDPSPPPLLTPASEPEVPTEVVPPTTEFRKKERKRTKTKEREREVEREDESESTTTKSESRKKQQLRLKDVTNTDSAPPPPPPKRTFLASPPSPPPQLPSPQASSSPLPEPPSDPEPEPEPEPESRERRVRRSVNYAEPKLNTKMRKPSSEGSSSRKRSSAAAVLSTTPEPDPAMIPLPPSRRDSKRLPSVSGMDTPMPSTKRTSTSTARPLLHKYSEDDNEGEEDEGAEADEEYVPPKRFTAGWVNVEGRRRGRKMDGEERRHSMAV